MKIEILGTGCPKCKMLEANAKKAAAELGIKAEIAKVTEVDKIIEYGVMYTPALAIDGNVKVSGRIADVSEIKKLMK
jgi:small redox-active disulfide protein 2